MPFSTRTEMIDAHRDGDGGHAVTVAQAWWVQVAVGAAEAEWAADHLWELGTTAVAESGGGLRAGFPDQEGAERAARALRQRWPACAGADDGAWRLPWRRYVGPVTVGRLMIRPVWSDSLEAPPPGVSVIHIDLDLTTGPAAPSDSAEVYGSGHHSSTRLCLASLQRAGPVGRSLLDLGCGTGILAVAGAVLGSHPVVALDLDPAAARITAANAALNQVQVLALAGPLRAVRGDFDIIVANLGGALAPMALAGDLVGRLAPSGVVIIGGLLRGQQARVRSAFVPVLIQQDEQEEDGWVVVTFGRPVRPGWNLKTV